MRRAATLALLLTTLSACSSIQWDKMGERWCESARHCECKSDDCLRR